MSDSLRFRRRLFAAHRNVSKYSEDLAGLVQAELGCDIPYIGYGYDFSAFFEKAELRDILDSITLVWRSLKTRYASLAGDWHNLVSRIIAEEGLSYALDERCGVRYAVDAEFERSRSSTIALLDGPRHAGARASVESCFTALDSVPSDTLAAVRHCWDALENTFKQLMLGKASRLGATEMKALRMRLDECYQDQSLNAARLLSDGLSSWTSAVQQYRHAPGVPEPKSPPIELAVVIISTGLGHLRWMLFLDGRLKH